VAPADPLKGRDVAPATCLKRGGDDGRGAAICKSLYGARIFLLKFSTIQLVFHPIPTLSLPLKGRGRKAKGLLERRGGNACCLLELKGDVTPVVCRNGGDVTPVVSLKGRREQAWTEN
jgi:hypothetical protein